MREFKKPKKITPGEILSTSCVYDTRKRLQTKFGLETNDEMCIDFMLYYPLQKRFAGDESMFQCSMVQFRGNNTGTGIVCGTLVDPRAYSIQANPSLNDIVGTPDRFGRKPDACAVAPKNSTFAPSVSDVRNDTGQSNNSSSTASCFPGTSVVSTRVGKLRMHELRIWDEVHIGRGCTPLFSCLRIAPPQGGLHLWSCAPRGIRSRSLNGIICTLVTCGWRRKKFGWALRCMRILGLLRRL